MGPNVVFLYDGIAVKDVFSIKQLFAQDNKTFALHTYCIGAGRFHAEYTGFLSPNKAGLDAATRARLTKELVKSGWSANRIQRVPSQSAC